LLEGNAEYIEIQMKKASFKITGIGEKSIAFEKQSGGTGHTLSIDTLSKMYEKETSTLKHRSGLTVYYLPLLQKLLKHGESIPVQAKTENLRQFVIIIDEINRANISRVFGELITLIEEDKRIGRRNEMVAVLPSGESFGIPPNLHLIGTMNTADKSIALIDIALRRRFEFEKLYPDSDKVIDQCKSLFDKLNNHIVDQKGPDFQIGHAYLMEKEDEKFDLEKIMNKKIIPLLYEYFMNDGNAVSSALKSAGIVVKKNYGLYEFESYSGE